MAKMVKGRYVALLEIDFHYPENDDNKSARELMDAFINTAFKVDLEECITDYLGTKEDCTVNLNQLNAYAYEVEYE
jgi:hypothetical protein